MATKEELLKQRINKIYPIGNIAPNLAKTPAAKPIMLSGEPLTGPQLPNLARTPAAPITPPPPTPGTGMGILGNQAGPPPMPGGMNTGLGALGNQPAVTPSIGPVNPLTNTPVTPRIATPRPVINSLTNQPVIVAQRSTLGPEPGTPASIGTRPTSLGILGKAGRFLPVATAALTAADVANRAMSSPEESRAIQREDIAGTLLSRGLSPEEAEMYSNKSAGSPKITREKSLVPAPAQFTSSFFETPATRANEAAGGGFRGAGAGLQASLKGLFENYVNPAWKVGQEMRAGFTGEAVPSITSDSSRVILPSPAEEAARRQRLSTATMVARPEGTASIQPSTGITTVPRNEKERIAGIAGRISTENPYGADITNPAVRTGQIRVGAATDAEAARNLESRALQDQAVQAEVARLNRATEAVRSLNEARNPRFSFGASSIGGGPDTLDVASGRVINRDTPVNVVADRMRGAIESSRGLGGGKAGRLIAEQMGKAYIADKELQQAEMQANVKQGINPLDLNRFILDQQKFAQQQGLDKARLNIDEATLRDRMTGTALEGRKYADARKKDFMSTFSYPDKGAPTDQIASTVLAMSDATGGVISPEQMTVYFQQAAKEAGVDWKNAPPKDFKALADRAMALATAANR